MEQNKSYILILGETGTGKSNLGNFLLNKKEFKTSDSTSSVTKVPTLGKGNNYEIIDCPGLNDSEDKDEEHLKNIVHELKKNKNLNVILLLLNYQCCRLTKNTKTLIKLFTIIFQLNRFLNNFGIVFTKCYYEEDEEEDLNKKKRDWNNAIKDLIKKSSNTDLPKNFDNISLTFFFVNLNPKKSLEKLDERTKQNMKTLFLWIEYLPKINVDLIEDEHDNMGYKEEIEEETKDEVIIKNDKKITESKIRKRKKYTSVDNQIKYGEWEEWNTINIKEEDIPEIKKYKEEFEKFRQEKEELEKKIEEAKKKNDSELMKLKLEYQARMEEARARAEAIRSQHKENVFSNLLGALALGITGAIFKEREPKPKPINEVYLPPDLSFNSRNHSNEDKDDEEDDDN
jgi:GTP-binding protein EngB required for normal cell division